MPFKTTVNKQREAVQLASSARQLAPEVAALVHQLLAEHLREGEVMPDVRLIQELVGRYLEASGAQLLEVDSRYTVDVRANQELLDRRESLVGILRERLRDIRFLADRHFGVERSKKLMPVRNLQKYSAHTLVQAGRQVVALLRDPQYALDQVTSTGLLANARVLSDALELECNELAQLLDKQLAGQKREKQSGLKVKLAEIKAATEAARRSADFLAGIYRLVGLDFDAQRLRPTVRRKKAMPTDDEDGDAPEKKSAALTPEVVDLGN